MAVPDDMVMFELPDGEWIRLLIESGLRSSR